MEYSNGVRSKSHGHVCFLLFLDAIVGAIQKSISHGIGCSTQVASNVSHKTRQINDVAVIVASQVAGLLRQNSS